MRRLFIVFISIFVLLEIFFSYSKLRFRSNLGDSAKYNKRLAMELVPNFNASIQHKDYLTLFKEYPLVINKKGLRVTETCHVCRERVLFLGGSIPFGYGVKKALTDYYARLNPEVNVENWGVFGFGPTQHYIRFVIQRDHQAYSSDPIKEIFYYLSLPADYDRVAVKASWLLHGAYLKKTKNKLEVIDSSSELSMAHRLFHFLPVELDSSALYSAIKNYFISRYKKIGRDDKDLTHFIISKTLLNFKQGYPDVKINIIIDGKVSSGFMEKYYSEFKIFDVSNFYRGKNKEDYQAPYIQHPNEKFHKEFAKYLNNSLN